MPSSVTTPTPGNPDHDPSYGRTRLFKRPSYWLIFLAIQVLAFASSVIGGPYLALFLSMPGGLLVFSLPFNPPLFTAMLFIPIFNALCWFFLGAVISYFWPYV